MIVLCTDFGLEGPYIGQVKAALYQHLPGCKVVDLFSDLPPYNPPAAAVLLAAYCQNFPVGTVFLCVVDPGVGMPARRGVVVKAAGCWFVGPDNGLFDLVMKRDCDSRWWTICWQPATLSNTFHGRDLFAPIAAELANGLFSEDKLMPIERPPLDVVVDDYPCVVYLDRFGNILSGIRAATISPTAVVTLCGHKIRSARTFDEVDVGALFWFENSNGLLEIAANRASAAQLLNVTVGDKVVC